MRRRTRPGNHINKPPHDIHRETMGSFSPILARQNHLGQGRELIQRKHTANQAFADHSVAVGDEESRRNQDPAQGPRRGRRTTLRYKSRSGIVTTNICYARVFTGRWAHYVKIAEDLFYLQYVARDIPVKLQASSFNVARFPHQATQYMNTFYRQKHDLLIGASVGESGLGV